MQAQAHKDYQEERSHLESTQQWIEQKSSHLVEENKGLEKEIVQLKKSVSSAFDERLVLKQQM